MHFQKPKHFGEAAVEITLATYSMCCPGVCAGQSRTAEEAGRQPLVEEQQPPYNV